MTGSGTRRSSASARSPPTDMNQKPVVLQALPLLPSLGRQPADHHPAPPLPAPGPAREAWLREHGAGIEALVTSAAHGASAALINALPRLRVVSSFGVGLDQLDLGAAAQRGIPVGYTPDVLNDCVADLAFGLLLAAGRRIPEGDRFVRAGRWSAQPPTPFPLGRRVSGARLGIVGLGRIGRTIARRASGFDMDVRYQR